MDLPPDDNGLDLDDALPSPDQGEVFHALNEDITDGEWLEQTLAEIMVDDDVAHDIQMPDNDDGVDICDVCSAAPLPCDLSRSTCSCKHECAKHVMQTHEAMVHHLRTEVRDNQFFLEFVKHSV